VSGRLVTVCGVPRLAREEPVNHVLVRWPLGLLSLLAAVIHFAVTPEHFEEYVLFGVFFVVLAAFQFLWGVVMPQRPSPGVLWLGLVVNLGVIAIWVVSRTWGLPIGPEAGEAEEVGLLDGLSTAAEALIVLGSAWLLAGGRSRHSVQHVPPESRRATGAA
jgi:hypothetical protein